MQAKLIQVISTQERRGRGLDETDPIRMVDQIYDIDGNLLMERDPHAGKPITGEGPLRPMKESLQLLKQLNTEVVRVLALASDSTPEQTLDCLKKLISAPVKGV